MDRAWKTRRDSGWGNIEMSCAYLPYPESETQTDAQNVVMKHIQMPAGDDSRLEEVKQEIKTLKDIYPASFFKYAQRKTKGKRTVYLALVVLSMMDGSQIVMRGKSNLLSTEAARETFRNQHKKV